MQVKKFEAPTIQEALDHIKRELGPEAIILQTKKHKRGFGLMSKSSVEITAAVSERSLQKKKFLESKLPEERMAGLEKLPAEKQASIYNQYAERYLEKSATKTQDKVELSKRSTGAVSAGAATARMSTANQAPAPQASKVQVTSTPYIDIPDEPGTQAARQATRQSANITQEKAAMEEELRQLKRMIQELKSEQDRTTQVVPDAGGGLFQNEVLEDAFDQLILNGVDRRLAAGLVRQVGAELGDSRSRDPEQVLDQLAGEIMAKSEIVSLLNEINPRNGQPGAPALVALIGPTGVGKTTTVAKIATDAVTKRSLRVGLINLDTVKPAAAEQLGTYAKLLNVPYRSVSTVEELRAAVADFQSLDLVLIDTAGRSHKDPSAIQDLQAMLRSIENVNSQLVLCTNTRDQELYEASARFAPLRPNGLILSKLDETSIYGSIYNITQKAKLPLVYFTTGQRVPDDLEEASRERVAALVMDL